MQSSRIAVYRPDARQGWRRRRIRRHTGGAIRWSDLDLALRLGNTDVPIPAQVRKRYDHSRKLPKQEQAEQLYADARSRSRSRTSC